MKKIAGLIIVLYALMPLVAREGLAVAVDLGSFESILFDTAHLSIDLTLDLNEEFALRLPITMTAERVYDGPWYLEGGIFLNYHPLGWPLFISLSLAQVGVLINARWEEEPAVLFLNEMAVGWHFSIPPAIVLVPMVIIRDPNRVFEGEYAQMVDIFAHYPMVRCSLLFGWTFPVGQPRATRE
ncbi:MAG: hypothetical protein RBS49_02615 [Sphaerochaeta sp.]|jgi:hypothetical protein|nr:hypothetical protein [Sphaerochaeta sp.]MDX9914758.1 hypothetical protein [Sphaerochaeta sp.]